VLVGICMAFGGEGEVAQGGCELGVSQVGLDEPGMDASFAQMGGVGMSQGRAGPAGLGHARPVFGVAKGALDTGTTPGRGRRRALVVMAPRGGQEPGLVAMSVPVGA
jgi:hypothetical protein